MKLRVGGRYLGGALDWASRSIWRRSPMRARSVGFRFRPKSRSRGRCWPNRPLNSGERTWARLADGTPLVTAAQRGKGWIVLFHVTASPAWSSLPLSGLYVDMLRRVLDLASGARPGRHRARMHRPCFRRIATLDGFGHARKPPPKRLPIRGSELAKDRAVAATSGRSLRQAKAPRFASTRPSGYDAARAVRRSRACRTGVYSWTVGALALKSPLLALAILLLLVDAIDLAVAARAISPIPRDLISRVRALVALPPCSSSRRAHARADDAYDMKAALDTRLAYVITGIADVDDMSKAGLYGLGCVSQGTHVL